MVVILEPGFETISNWTYVESDSNGDFSGGKWTGWKTEGSYSYQLLVDSGGAQHTANYGDYAGVQQIINIPSGGFSIKFDANCFIGGYVPELLVDGTVVWTGSFGNPINVTVDLTAFAGNGRVLLFRFFAYSTFGYIGANYFAIDNIIESTYRYNVYVNSSTGNDANAGDSCVASHPVLTFGKAYSLLASGGNLHICNSGADFSSETVTLNKSFNIDLNGSDGYFYMPKSS